MLHCVKKSAIRCRGWPLGGVLAGALQGQHRLSRIMLQAAVVPSNARCLDNIPVEFSTFSGKIQSTVLYSKVYCVVAGPAVSSANQMTIGFPWYARDVATETTNFLLAYACLLALTVRCAKQRQENRRQNISLSRFTDHQSKHISIAPYHCTTTCLYTLL